MSSTEIVEKDQAFLLQFLRGTGLDVHVDDLEILHGDGSDRRFYRVLSPSKIVAVFPSLHHPKRKEEARATYMIGYHLHDLGVAIPEVLGHDRDTGLVLLADMGGNHLQQCVAGCTDSTSKETLYCKAVDVLLDFQIDGAQGFDVRCCWDTPAYDFDLMITRESDYFIQALCRDYAGQIVDNPEVKKECQGIARRASREPADFLLHRDYQSRNLMVQDGEVRIIDFQGARLGPLAYDLASLLFDPYVNLSAPERETIYEYYVRQASLRVNIDQKSFQEGYQFLAVQRVLQMLGAFGFLTVHKGKSFFEPFILPALVNLRYLLKQLSADCPLLLALVDKVEDAIHDCQHFTLSEKNGII